VLWIQRTEFRRIEKSDLRRSFPLIPSFVRSRFIISGPSTRLSLCFPFPLPPLPKPSTTYNYKKNSLHRSTTRPYTYHRIHLIFRSSNGSASTPHQITPAFTKNSVISLRIYHLIHRQLRLVGNGQIVIVTTDTSADNLRDIHDIRHIRDTSVSSSRQLSLYDQVLCIIY